MTSPLQMMRQEQLPQSTPESYAVEQMAAGRVPQPQQFGDDINLERHLKSMLMSTDQQKALDDDMLEQHRSLISQLRAPDQDDSAKWLAAAAGFLAPTKAGSFGESLGAAAGNLAPLMQKDKESRLKSLTDAAVQSYQFAKDSRTERMSRQKEAITGLVNLEKQRMLANRLNGGKASPAQQKIDAIAGAIVEGQLAAKGVNPDSPDYAKHHGAMMNVVRPKVAIMGQMNPDLRGQIEQSPEMNWEAPMPEFQKMITGFQTAAQQQAKTAKRRQDLQDKKDADAEAADKASAQAYTPSTDTAYEEGVPLYDQTPYSQFQDVKARDKYFNDQTTIKEKALKDLNTKFDNARKSRESLEQFKMAMKANGGETGASLLDQLPVVGDLALDVRAFLNPQVKQMQTIYENLAQSKRTPGEGAMSDKDREAYRKMVVSPKMSAESANLAISREEAVLTRAEEYQRFLEKMFSVNKHWNKGKADALWKQYTEANPLFDEDKNSMSGWKFNEVPKFEEWFKSKEDTFFKGRKKPKPDQVASAESNNWWA